MTSNTVSRQQNLIKLFSLLYRTEEVSRWMTTAMRLCGKIHVHGTNLPTVSIVLEMPGNYNIMVATIKTWATHTHTHTMHISWVQNLISPNTAIPQNSMYIYTIYHVHQTLAYLEIPCIFIQYTMFIRHWHTSKFRVHLYNIPHSSNTSTSPNSMCILLNLLHLLHIGTPQNSVYTYTVCHIH